MADHIEGDIPLLASVALSVSVCGSTPSEQSGRSQSQRGKSGQEFMRPGGC